MSKAPMSFKLALTNRTDAASAADSVKASIGRGAESVKLTVRGMASAVVSLMEALKDHPAEVSAVLTIRGNKPAR